MGKLAARKSDQHACPGHGLNSINKGSGKVKIEGLPAARVTDTCDCGAQIASGSSKVKIEGLPAARITDTTNHGGKIVSSASKVTIAD